MRALLLLAATVALAGCNQQPAEQPTLAQNEAAAREAAADLKGWDRVFGFPTETIGRLNQYGYRLAPYSAAQTGFAAKGAAITLSQSDAKSPNTGTVTVAGPDAETIDTIAFALSLTDEANAETAKKRLTDIVRAFLFQYRIDDKKALDAITREKTFDGTIGTTPTAIAIARTGGVRTLTVTFRRPSATAPAEAMVGNSQQP
ncbi:MULTISPECIES: hypothetical protein [unclassified Sphingomonas]|uniref:hypothetical protein n=1 Tax=unclassified Sphingomonas TaxID=196159 RepID=UPI00082F8409|nr:MULTISPECIES: hypothetical protein [unclassified Sphingomonas]